MAVTIKDVAALAGVSPSTVSRTCKNNPSISEETKERVRKAMIELGYEPNFQASNLASQNSRTIGIILPASAKEVYENSFYLEAVQGISHYCNGRQYMTTIVTGQDEAEILDAVRSMSRSGKVDGFIVLYSKKEDPVIDYLFNEGLLYILIGKATQYTNQTIYIDNDNLLAGREATEYLYQLGHRRIAYLGSDSSLIFSADRKAGYQLALASHQLPVRPEYDLNKMQDHVAAVYKGFDMSKLPGINEEVPVVWTHNYGKGRVFVCAICHGPDTLCRPNITSMLCRGTEWAASGEVTIPYPDIQGERRKNAWPFYNNITWSQMGEIKKW